jgi:hypothetical protein
MTSSLALDAVLEAPARQRPKALWAPEFVLPSKAFATVAKRGMRLVDLRSLGIIPGIAGGAVDNETRKRGYNAAADIVTQTNDGFDLNDLWDEFQKTVALQNAERTKIVQFMTFPVTNAVERVPQVSGADFEKASEYGEPVGVRPATSYFTLGYDLEWYDLAARFTWKFLADANRSQVDAINAMALEADNRLIFNKVMDALFNPANRLADINGMQDVNVYALYNADGTVPPRYKSYTFDGTHTHYLTSGAATIDSTDVDDMVEDLVSHGYSKQNGYVVAILMNRREVNVARTWRVAGGDTNDFVPAVGTPGMFLPRDVELFGGQPASSWRGLNVAGSYGDALIVEEDSMPVGYTLAIASGGPENLGNPVGLRQHSNSSLQGLRLVKGPNPDYPLVDSFYNRGFGTGIRQRGGAIVMQITVSATYTPPTFV